LKRRTGIYNRSVKILKTAPLVRTIRNDAKHAWFQEVGTGIYGPTGRPITPKNGKFLRFTINGRVVYARSVKGTPAKHILRDSLQKARP
jgi:hypothetical protein